MTTTAEISAEADRKRTMAVRAEREGDMKLRDQFLDQARARYHAAGDDEMARLCEQAKRM